MAYSTDIIALSPDHRWKLDGDSVDDVGALDSTDTSIDYTGTPLCEDVTNSAFTNADDDSIVSTASSDTSQASNDILYCGWFMADSIQQPPCRIFGDGGTTQSVAIYLGFGNNLIFEVDDDSASPMQIYGDTPLEANRKYHLAIGYTSDNVLVAYLDGVLQTDTTNPSGVALSTNRSAIRFGGSNGTSDFSLGGTPLKLVSIKSGYYNQWATFNVDIPTQSQIRTELFEKGTLADVTITNQADLDDLANTVRANASCCIRVTGNDTINLTADNVTFNDLASIHIQYTGTGTLNWTNTNGSNASISSVTNGGTINIINPATLTLDSGVSGYLTGAEISIYDDEIFGNHNFDTRLGFSASNTTDSYTFNYDGSANDIVIQVIKTGYVELILTHSLSGVDETVTLYPVVEENA